MRYVLCVVLLATHIGCSSNADEEARKAKLAEEEARKATLEEDARKKAADEEMHKAKAARIQVETLATVAKKFYLDHGHYPQALRDLTETPQPGGTGGTYCKREALLDPWGQTFHYDPSGPKTLAAGGEGPDIYSKGNPAAPKEIGTWMSMK
jgi:hypothetical protein